MTVTTNTNGTKVLNADAGMALRRKTDNGPTRITRVALSAWDAPDNWADCEYAQTEAEDEADVRPAPRTFSKLKITAALMAREKWLPVRDFLVQTGLYDLYLAAQDFREDDEFFVKGLAAIKEQFGMDDEEVEEILKEGEAND